LRFAIRSRSVSESYYSMLPYVVDVPNVTDSALLPETSSHRLSAFLMPRSSP
jgi:hypothetical protein